MNLAGFSFRLAATALILLGISAARAEDVPASAPVATTEAVAQPTTTAVASDAPAEPQAARDEKPPPGWKVEKRGSTVYWCTTAKATGSRVRTERQCTTPTGYREMVESARRETEEITRRVIPPSGG